MAIRNSWKPSTKTTSKYHAKRTEVDDIKFASQKEARRYMVLRLLEMGGQIQDLRLQVPYVIIEKSKHGKAIKYIADFVYKENGKEIIEDTKGYKTDVYKIKKRLMAEKGFNIKET